MATELKLPIYVLVDNDPWGPWHLFGAQAGKHQPCLRIDADGGPGTCAFGVWSAFDYKKFTMPKAVEIKLTDGRYHPGRADEGVTMVQGQEVAARNPSDRGQRLQDGGRRALLTKRISFITEEYIPKKLRDKDYLQ